MLAEAIITNSAETAAPPPRPSVRSAGDRLRAALMALSGQRGQIVTHSERSWASITFTGARHRLAMQFSGAEAVAAGEHFIAALPDHEFTIPGQLVAEATVIEAEHRLIPSPRLVLQCELLLLEDV